MIANLKKVAIYAHYSPNARVLSHSWPYLESLINLGFSVIFVSNSDISIEDTSKLKGKNIKIIIRKNIGLDFGMWKSALENIDISSTGQLLLTNSSIIGPLKPLGAIFEESAKWQCDFWGMTDNTEIAHHLQSYFIVFSERVIRSQAFKLFWSAVLPYSSKNQIIRSYEVGLTVWLEEQGFTWRPYISQSSVWQTYSQQRGFLKRTADRIRRRRVNLENITLCYAGLLVEMGFPFQKCAYLDSTGGRSAFELDVNVGKL